MTGTDMTGTDKVRLAFDGPIATVTLNRPEKLHALDAEMIDGLHAAAMAIDRSETCRAVILCSAGSVAFCSGGDIKAWSALPALDMWRHWIPEGHRAFDRLAGLRQPTIAVVDGIAHGGGLELALSCDLRLIADDTACSLPEVTVATIPGWAGTARLQRMIGPTRAKYMALTGARIDARTATDWGLFNECLPRDQLAERAHAIASRIAGNAPVCVQAAKQLIDLAVAGGDNRTGEALASALVSGLADVREGVAAFKERRAPNFTGR